jgi:hypothetical protein
MTASVEALLFGLVRRGLLDLLDAASREHHVSREEILGRSRLQSIVAGRRGLCRALRERGMSYPEIGSLIGRDHTSVMNLVRDDGTKKVPATVWLAKTRAQVRARCGMCDAPYDDHLSRPPHALPSRGCAGFALRASECG